MIIVLADFYESHMLFIKIYFIVPRGYFCCKFICKFVNRPIPPEHLQHEIDGRAEEQTDDDAHADDGSFGFVRFLRLGHHFTADGADLFPFAEQGAASRACFHFAFHFIGNRLTRRCIG